MTDLVHVSHADTNTFGMLVPAAELADKISRTEFVPSGLRGKPDAIAACVLFGHEVGIPPMQSLSKIHVVDGRPAMAAELMRAVVLRAGHHIWFEDTTTTKVTVCARRGEWPEQQISRVTWTMDDAKKAGLDGRQNWRKYPRAMLKARATSEVCRDVFPDVLGGISYSVEELTDGVEIDDLPDGEPVEAKKTQTRSAPAKKAAAKKAAAKPAPPAAERTTELPPLPGEDDDIVEAEVVTPAASGKPTEVKLSQKLVIRCREVGIDTDAARHAFVAAATDGRTESTKDVTSGEADWILELCDRIERQELRFTNSGGGTWRLEDPADDDVAEAELVDEPPPAPAAAPVGDQVDGWDAERWKAELQARGLRPTQAIKQAQSLARELGQDGPGNLAQLAADREVGQLVWIWVLEHES